MSATPRCRRVVILLVAIVVGSPLHTSAQNAMGDSPCGANPTSFSNWLNVRLCELMRSSVPVDKHVEAPAATAASTALVEKATAPDVFSLALGLVNAGSKPGEDKRATSMTLSAFALRASVTGDNPMNPAVYDRYRNWRRWSFTVGRAEALQAGAAEGRVFGGKALIIDQRDVSDASNDSRFKALTASLGPGNDAVGGALLAAQDFIARSLPDLSQGMSATAFAAANLDANFAATLAKLTDKQRAELDVVLSEFADRLAASQAEVKKVIEQIRHAPQLAVTYQAIVRDENADDEHHFGVAYDMGLGSRLSATVNGTFVKTDRKLVADTTVGKVAGEMQFDLNRVTSFGDLVRRPGRDPMTVAIAGLGEWHSDDGPTIAKVQLKFTLPLPGIVAGLKVPISVTVANRTELIDEKEVRGQVGFTVDLSKIQKSLGGLAGR